MCVLIGSLTVLGGFVFTAVSLVIPPLLHWIVFRKEQKGVKNMQDLCGFVFSGCFMLVATIFSAITLIQNLHWYVCWNTHNQILHKFASSSSSFEING